MLLIVQLMLGQASVLADAALRKRDQRGAAEWAGDQMDATNAGSRLGRLDCLTAWHTRITRGLLISSVKLEAPPGFEPGVEVLQTGSAITKLLSRLAFWSALIVV